MEAFAIMPRLPAKQREADKVSTRLEDGSFAAAAHDAPSRHAFEVSIEQVDRLVAYGHMDTFRVFL